MPLTTTSACHNQIYLLWGLEELPLRQAFRHNTARTSLLVGPPEYINHLLRFSMTRFRFWPHQRLDLLSVLLDSCGVLALIVGISTGELTVALGIGYAATALGFAFAIGVVVCEKCCMREPR